MLTEYCFTFSTKERVPFKLVFETISFEDAMKYKNETKEEKEKEE